MKGAVALARRLNVSELVIASTIIALGTGCLLYTSDAADDLLCVDLGGRRIIKKKKYSHSITSISILPVIQPDHSNTYSELIIQ